MEPPSDRSARSRAVVYGLRPGARQQALQPLCRCHHPGLYPQPLILGAITSSWIKTSIGTLTASTYLAMPASRKSATATALLPAGPDYSLLKQFSRPRRFQRRSAPPCASAFSRWSFGATAPMQMRHPSIQSPALTRPIWRQPSFEVCHRHRGLAFSPRGGAPKAL